MNVLSIQRILSGKHCSISSAINERNNVGEKDVLHSKSSAPPGLRSLSVRIDCRQWCHRHRPTCLIASTSIRLHRYLDGLAGRSRSYENRYLDLSWAGNGIVLLQRLDRICIFCLSYGELQLPTKETVALDWWWREKQKKLKITELCQLKKKSEMQFFIYVFFPHLFAKKDKTEMQII